jgi:hypothetical protein
MVRIEPGAMHARDASGAVGGSGDQSREGSRQRIIALTVIATRMKTESAGVDDCGIEATMPEIGVGQRAGDRPRYGEQTARRVGRTARCRRRSSRGGRGDVGQGQAQKRARLIHRVADRRQTAIERDEIEEVAVFVGGGIGLMCNCT